MTFKKILSEEQERRLLVDHEDGLYVDELSVVYLVSIRTVYRTLERYGLEPNSRKRKKRRRRVRKPNEMRVVELSPCGTNAAYQRHRRNGEYPCSACLEAHALNVKEFREKRK